MSPIHRADQDRRDLDPDDSQGQPGAGTGEAADTVAMPTFQDIYEQLSQREAELEAAYGISDSQQESLDQARAQLAGLREVLEQVGIMAANAPEDGDSFAVLEQIAMHVASAEVEPLPEPDAAAATALEQREMFASQNELLAAERDQLRELLVEMFRNISPAGAMAVSRATAATWLIRASLTAEQVPFVGAAAAQPEPDPVAALYPSAVARLSAGLRDVVHACRRGDVPPAIEPLAAHALADVDALQLPEADHALVLAEAEVAATRAYSGGAVVITFAPGAPAERAAELRDAMAAQCDVPVFAVADVAAVRAWAPDAGQLMREPRTAWRLLDQARAEVHDRKAQLRATEDEVRALHAKLTERTAQLSRLLGRYRSNTSGMVDRMTGVQLAREYTAAGLPLRDDLSRLAGQ